MLSGIFDLPQASLEALQEDLSARIDAGTRKMVLNLALLTQLDSTGINVILATFGRMKEEHGRLVLCSLGERVRRSMNITHLDQALQIVADEDTAVRSLSGGT